jgi:hypothetical protein
MSLKKWQSIYKTGREIIWSVLELMNKIINIKA